MKIHNVIAENNGNTIVIWAVDDDENFYRSEIICGEDGEVIHMEDLRLVSFKVIRDEYTKYMDQTTADAFRRLRE